MGHTDRNARRAPPPRPRVVSRGLSWTSSRGSGRHVPLAEESSIGLLRGNIRLASGRRSQLAACRPRAKSTASSTRSAYCLRAAAGAADARWRGGPRLLFTKRLWCDVSFYLLLAQYTSANRGRCARPLGYFSFFHRLCAARAAGLIIDEGPAGGVPPVSIRQRGRTCGGGGRVEAGPERGLLARWGSPVSSPAPPALSTTPPCCLAYLRFLLRRERNGAAVAAAAHDRVPKGDPQRRCRGRPRASKRQTGKGGKMSLMAVGIDIKYIGGRPPLRPMFPPFRQNILVTDCGGEPGWDDWTQPSFFSSPSRGAHSRVQALPPRS